MRRLSTTLALLPAAFLLASAGDPPPTLNEDFRITPDDAAAFDLFGYSVDVEGPLALVGAPGKFTTVNQGGAAYLFDSTTGDQLHALVPSDPQTNDSFGRYLALQGTTAWITAYHDDDNGTDSGSIYRYDALTGIELGKLYPDDGVADHEFGRSIAIGDGTVIVGAAGDPVNGERSGSAYLFDFSSLQQLQKLVPDDGAPNDHFGRSSAIDGGLCLVGAPGDDDNGGASGSAYVFDVATGVQLRKLLPDDGESSSLFGTSVALEGDYAVVGAHFDDAQATNSGSVYVFQASTGKQLYKLDSESNAIDHFFGYDVAVDGGVLVVGMYGSDALGNEAGEAFLYELSSGALLAELQASDSTPGDWLGFSVDLDGGRVIAGAYHALSLNRGTAYFFDVPEEENSGWASCFGDGTGGICPCSNHGDSGGGCASSSGGGARLVGDGHASLTSDSFRLDVLGVPGARPGLLLRGASQPGGGLGVQLADGLLCSIGESARSHVQLTADGATSFTDFHGAPFGAASYGAFQVVNYQFWYRDPANGCSGQGFNSTNAWSVIWQP